MSSADRYEECLCRYARLLPGLVILLSFLLYHSFSLLPKPAQNDVPDDSRVPVWPDIVPITSYDSTLFQNRDGAIHVREGSLAKRFRLAGTFFAYGEEGVSDSRKAILDDFPEGTQHIVGENDNIQDVRVVRIFRDRIILRHGGNEEELWLSFSRPATEKDFSKTSGGKTGESGSAFDGSDSFGIKRVGENKWVFDRQALIDYYQELMDEPQRLVAVFDSLKPLYNDRGKITGYQLGIESEEDFFEAAGLKEGDIVRAVNNVKMTNRRRAEYFIREFVNDRANIFMIDIEREGVKQKLDYRLR